MLAPLIAAVLLQTADVPILSGVGISGVTQGGRAPVGIDTVQNLIVTGKWTTPKAGDTVPGARGGDRSWASVTANKDGVFEGGATGGGYIDAVVDSDVDKPMILAASGDTMVYINGEPRAGDPYSTGYLKLPFLMKKGRNEFLFSCGRGRLQAKLLQPDVPGGRIQLRGMDDQTLPDAVMGEDRELVGAVPIANCSTQWLRGLRLRVDQSSNARAPGQSSMVGMSSLPPIPPLSVRKVLFRFRLQKVEPPRDVQLILSIDGVEARPLPVSIRMRKPTEHYKRTFVSKIDGSVQYYGVAPSLKPSKDNALILTVHGAGVEAIGQAQAYKPKDWSTIVAATNRRPYGFDWEDWGRMDALEVLEDAKKTFAYDPNRVILTGHSMGGHGAWSIGLTYPNLFAAIGPSAGWISFWSYAGGWEPRDPNPVETMMRRSMNSSDTLLMLRNALSEDTFILHGDKDDNVPVEQARTMKAKLTEIGAEFQYHEEPGAGHWWGDQCVDWPPMFTMFDAAKFTEGESFEFATVNPGVSATDRGITVEQQIDPLLPSRVSARRVDGVWNLKTENVAALGLDPQILALTPKLVVDEATILANGNIPESLRHLRLEGRAWIPVGKQSSATKSPTRSGPFKLAFQNRMVFVVGTHGTAEENAWSQNKARFDAESWYYRGNGSVDIATDDQIGKYKDRNLILFGNADTNSAFKLISASPMQVRRGSIEVGSHKFAGDDLAALYLYPQGNRMIGVVGGTGMPGLRYTDRLPYFTSGVAYPDWTVLRTSTLTEGSKAIEAAGFFGNDWKFDAKQSAFK